MVDDAANDRPIDDPRARIRALSSQLVERQRAIALSPAIEAEGAVTAGTNRSRAAEFAAGERDIFEFAEGHERAGERPRDR